MPLSFNKVVTVENLTWPQVAEAIVRNICGVISSPFNTVHWRMWRSAVAQLASARVRLQVLREELLCNGGEVQNQVANDILLILNSKY